MADRHREPWTKAEDRFVVQTYGVVGWPPCRIAKVLGRTRVSLMKRTYHLLKSRRTFGTGTAELPVADLWGKFERRRCPKVSGREIPAGSTTAAHPQGRRSNLFPITRKVRRQIVWIDAQDHLGDDGTDHDQAAHETRA